jgi:membrane protein DedA with SNARE-associated domain
VQLLLIKYGLLAVFLAAAIEADVVPVLTGALAHFGYMNARLAIICAASGALAGDCLWFFAGWKHSTRIQRRSIYVRIAPMVERLTARIGLWQIPASHLIYGTRVATMIQFGVRRVTLTRFVLADGSACLVITTILFALGFGLSASVTQVIGHVKRLELFMLCLLVASGLVFHLVSQIVRRTFATAPTGSQTKSYER